MARMQDIVVYIDAGAGPQAVPLPTITPRPPEVAVAYHFLPGQTGQIGIQPDPAASQVLLDLPGGGQSFYVIGRANHSAVVLEFQHQIFAAPSPGVSSVPHGLSAMPDMIYCEHADLAQVDPFVVTGYDATDIFFEVFPAGPPGPVNVTVNAWLLSSREVAVATEQIMPDIVLAAGGAPVVVPHNLGVVPDAIFLTPFQPPAGVAPAGEPILLGADATSVTLQNSAAAGNPLNMRGWFQRTYSVQL